MFPLPLTTGRSSHLIGANGAGKTTMLHTISGIKKPTSGQILLDGQDITIHRRETACKAASRSRRKGAAFPSR